MPEHCTSRGHDDAVSPHTVTCVHTATAELPVVAITAPWFAALRRRPRWTLTVHTHDGRLVTEQQHVTYDGAVTAAVVVCRYLRFGTTTVDLAA